MKDFVAAICPINLDILYAGLPRVPGLGEEVFAKQFDFQMGGGSTASVITLTRLGVDARLGTFLSDDPMSYFAQKILDENNVKYQNLYQGNGRPIRVTSIASFPQDRYFLSYFPDESEFECTDEQVYSFLTGSKVCQADRVHDSVLKRLKKEGTRIVFDVGWRDDLDIENLKGILQYVDVFTPNDKEAVKMTEKSTPEEALEVIDRFVKHAIVKIGKKGCITKLDGRIIHVPALDVFKTVDTTGAGDAFLGGVMYGLYNDWDIVQCMRMGNITGGYSTTELGCCKAHLTLDKAMELMSHYK